MTNSIAIVLGAIIAGLVVLDALVFEQANLLFLARKFLEFLEWMAFWR